MNTVVDLLSSSDNWSNKTNSARGKGPNWGFAKDDVEG